MVQVIVTFIGLYTCYFMTASHPGFFAHPLVCTLVVTLTLDFKIYPKLVSLPVLGLLSTVFSKTSSGTVSSAAGPLRALSLRHVFFQLFWIKEQHLLQEVLGQFYAPVVCHLKANKDQAKHWKCSYFSHFVGSCGNRVFVSFIHFGSHFMGCCVLAYVSPLVSELLTKYIDLNQTSINPYFHLLFSYRRTILKQTTVTFTSFF